MTERKELVEMGTTGSGPGTSEGSKKPEFPDRGNSSNRVIQIQTEMGFEVKEKRRQKAKKKAKGEEVKDGKKDASKYETDVHHMDNKQILDKLETDMEKGLTSQQVVDKRLTCGPNMLTPPPSLPWYLKLLGSIFGGFFNQLLWMGAILCFLAYILDNEQISYMYLGVVLAVVVTLTGIFGYYQESKSDDIMEGFKNLQPEDVTVTRNGKQEKIDPVDLVPGDIIEIRYGMKMPADVRILECTKDCEVDNASLTGEAEPQKRKWVKVDDPECLPIESPNLCFFGTNLLQGTGTAVVYYTGDRTLMGSIAIMAADTGAVETPIAREIHDFVVKISAIAFVLGISFFIFGMLSNPDWLANIVFLIGIIVANVPEGLLATVTVSLTLTARRMAIKQVRVKNLESVETLGSTSVICSDKTGTLTTSIMTCQDIMFDMRIAGCDTSDPTHATKGDFYDEDDNQVESFRRLIRCGVLCNNSKMIMDKGREKFTSDPTEQAIFKFCLGNLGNTLKKRGQKAEDFREVHYPQTAAIPFNSKNKWQVSVHTVSTEEACFDQESVGDSLVEIKGAPERILSMCSTYVFEGKEYDMDEKAKERIRALNTQLAEQGERVLGFADNLLNRNAFPQDVEEPTFDSKSMTVTSAKGTAQVPPSQVREGCGKVFVQLVSGDEFTIDLSECRDSQGKEFETPNKVTINALKEVLARDISYHPAQQRMFEFKFSKQAGELEDEFTMGDCQIKEGAKILLAIGRYRFSGTGAHDANWPMKGFKFLGFYAMIDPPRPSVPDAVLKCQAAGIKVVMVTGDHPTTAEAIAKQVNIIPKWEIDPRDPNKKRRVEIGRWVKGGQPAKVPEDPTFSGVVVAGGKLLEELERGETDPDYETKFWNNVLTRRYCVFARTSPRQKLLIVQACQQRGGIVAVTGDGVNDSPALKKADIGVAMGITGTEVAKDAADMILLDDNFSSIVNGVEEGRIIFDNLKKSIAYTLSSNIPEIAPFLIFQCFGIPLPLSTVMILLVDLGTDLAPAISLAHEGKEADIMQRPPRDPTRDNLVTWRLISFSYLQIGVLQALAGFFAYYCVLFEYGLQPNMLWGLDYRGIIFPFSTQDDVVKNVYFLWCFDNPSDWPCVYTPKTFECDWIGWDDDQKADRFKTWLNFYDNWAADPVTLLDTTNNNAATELNPWTEEGCAVTGAEDVGKALYSSMICKWAKNSDATLEGPGDCDAVPVPGTGPYAGQTVSYNSKGATANVGLSVSKRYDQRFCDDKDLDDDNWAEPQDGDDCAAVNTIINYYYDGEQAGSLCDNNGESLTNGNGHVASIFPMQQSDRNEMLIKSNTAYFISIIVVQWADLMICKTRARSLFEQGMTNTFMNWSLFFETVLGAFLCYNPLAHLIAGTRPISFVWWTPAVPFSLAIYSYDELRKGWIRANPNGWLRYNTYW